MAVPKIIPYDVELRSVNPVRSFDRPKAYTNDLKSVEFQFKILDMTSIELNTATAITLVYMRDGSFFANPSTDVERVGNVFSYLLKENEGNHAGVAQIQLVVTFDDAEFASQLFDFEIINGLETKVAQEIMIHDWTTLTREARAYIDQFVADEVLRDAQFDNAQFDRNVAFVSSQESRDLAFGVEQTDRGAAFTTEQTNRNTAFNSAQDSRDLTFTASESSRTTAESGRVTAESNRVTAESNRVTKEGQRVTAENNRVTAEGNRVTAESGRVTAENARVTAETNRAAAFTAFDTRLTAEETATANNKVSAVKGKTFADVDARFEDVETDTTMMGTNLVTNGDFSNGTTGWGNANSTIRIDTGRLGITATSQYGNVSKSIATVAGNIYYAAALLTGTAASNYFQFGSVQKLLTLTGAQQAISFVVTATGTTSLLYAVDNRTTGWTEFFVDNVLVIDLTTAFGKGNEPTAEQMDGILAKFTNSWFDGTKNLFQAKASLNKLMALDARTEFEMKNLVANGDFSNGATGWNASTVVVGGRGSRTSTAQYQAIEQPIKTVVGNKYYAAALVEATTDHYLKFGTGTDQKPKSTSYQRLSLITTAAVSEIPLQIGDGRASDWTPYYVDDILVINLTQTFGAGKEPTLAEMDRLMARFPNSWFDGVKPIQTIENLYFEKAGKTQEAWITPTLLNGWEAYDGVSAPQYIKDELGFVLFRGLLKTGVAGTNAFTIPVGYRPNKSYYSFTRDGSNKGMNGYVTQGGTYMPTGVTYTSYVSLDGIRYRAEA